MKHLDSKHLLRNQEDMVVYGSHELSLSLLNSGVESFLNQHIVSSNNMDL